MPPGMDIRSPFFLLLLLPGITGQIVSSTTSPATSPVHEVTSAPATSPTSVSATSPVHEVTSAPATSPTSVSATSPVHEVTSAPATSPTSVSDTSPVHEVTSALTTSPTSVSATSPVHEVTSAPATSPTSVSATSPVHEVTSAPATSPTSVSATSPVHEVTSALATTMPVGTLSTPSSVPSHTGTPTTLPSPSHSTGSPVTTSTQSTAPQVSAGLSFFFLSFYITNLQFNSSLEDPSSKYYQELQRNVSALISQIYGQKNFLGLSGIRFRPGSVVVDLILAFQEGSTNEVTVQSQFIQNIPQAARYNLNISRVTVRDVLSPSSAQSGVPGWGIALLVLVCVLLALAIIYFIALAVCQCRRKNCGQLDLFPTRDTYHPMSEYPTYHTHGRYVPPGSTRRSPYEEVSAGNGGSGLSYTNPAVAATSANL
nr:mucin-1 isoform X18 [Oryctolagus cuniculus]